MPNTDFILAASGRPFQDWDAANMKASMMAADLGDRSFKVVEHPEGGYAVACGEEASDVAVALVAEPITEPVTDTEVGAPQYEVPEAPADALAREMADERGDRLTPVQDGIGGVIPSVQAEERRPQPAIDDDLVADKADAAINTTLPTAATIETVPTLTDYTGQFPAQFALNVAPRAFVQLHLLTLLGITFMLFPHWLLAPLGGFAGFQDPTLGASVLGGIRLGAMILGICALSKFLYTYLLYRYVITEDSVEANFGFIARDAPKVYFAHIRTTKVVQAWWQRVLVVGDVALGTGATDQHEVVLKHISNPKRIEQELERRYIPFIRSQHRVID